MKPIKLSEVEIEARLSKFPNWTLENGQIAREFTFRKFSEAVRFFNQVAEIAEDLKHHPDFYNSYTNCRIAINTHDVEGLSDLDFQFAARVDALKY
jgi:4a-hydroxytetrahydrobiopterin dehydratase